MSTRCKGRVPLRHGINTEGNSRHALAALCLLLLVLSGAPAWSARIAAGDLDPSFGLDGKVLTGFGSPDAHANAVAIQADGKIVVAGRLSPDGRLALARYEADGMLDPTFGLAGKVTTDDTAPGLGVAIQSDGGIVVAGGVLLRFNTDGTPDSTFGGDGAVEAAAVYDLALQADDKIVVAGTINGTSGLARFLPDGTMDPTFAGDGVVNATGGSPAIQPDGRIVVIGDAVLTRYNSDGSQEGTFGGDGTVSIGRSAAEYVFWNGDHAIQPDGKIVVAARAEECSPFGCDTYNMLLRFNSDGSRDATFGPYGEGRVYWGRPRPAAIVFQADGKIVVAGALANGRFTVTRLNPNGSLDKAYGDEGTQRTRFTPYAGTLSALAIQSDDKVIVVGSAEGAHRLRFALARYLP
jgi:uncharacterized delta-60 repeat protein